MRAIVFILLLVYTRCEDYSMRRAKILEQEAKIALGGNTTLSDQEAIVNKCLMRHKFNEINYGFGHPDKYPFSHHFFSYKDMIPRSKVFKIIKAMPKGAVLHLHDVAVLGPDYWLNITYMDHLYVCLGKQIQFLFSDATPNGTCNGNWQLMRDIRRTTKNITAFDSVIRKHFTLVVKNPDLVYNNIQTTWDIFRNYFSTTYFISSYRPVRERYIYDVLQALKKDNIMYAELRSSLHTLYELNGTHYDKLTTAKIYKKVINKFVNENPDFYGVKIIFSLWRGSADIPDNVQLAREINKKVPDLIVGFDLVGQEDLGPPLIDFAPLFNTVKDLSFFFHAGETDWYGTSSDENLVDAVLLGAKRIGHAYALPKHPAIMKQVIKNDIGIEVNVLSNAVLSLVRDVRNHPLSVFLSHGLPLVLSSDDPGAWGADPLSDDFYVAFVGVASKQSDLRMLKTLALNSLKYSALDPANKGKVLRAFNLRWEHFINNLDCSLY